jgi:isopenicillin-N N-acyltransferase-like protein
MAKGSGIPVEHLVLLNVRTDLAAIQSPLAPSMGESTSAFFSPRATADEAPIHAHSWSGAKFLHGEGLLVCLEYQYPPQEEKADIFIVTEAGMISGCGMNAKGLAVTGNRLVSTNDQLPSKDWAFPVECLERYILEFSSVNKVRDLLEEAKRHASRHLLVTDSAGHSVSLEVTPKHIHVHHGELGSQARLHTNHFQSFEAFTHRRETGDRYPWKESQPRLARLKDCLAEQGGAANLSRQQIVDIFSDHHLRGSPGAICQHKEDDQKTMTMALVMFDTKRRVISVCKGPPCEGKMMHFTFQRGAQDAGPNKTAPKTKIKLVSRRPTTTKEDTDDSSELLSEADTVVFAPLNNSPVSDRGRAGAPPPSPVLTTRLRALAPAPPPSPVRDVATASDGPKGETQSTPRERSKRKAPASPPALLRSLASLEDLEVEGGDRPKKKARLSDPDADMDTSWEG